MERLEGVETPREREGEDQNQDKDKMPGNLNMEDHGRLGTNPSVFFLKVLLFLIPCRCYVSAHGYEHGITSALQ